MAYLSTGKFGFIKDLLPTLLCTLIITGCTKAYIRGSNREATESRHVAGFTAITSSGSANVSIMQGEEFKITVIGPENVLPYYETKLAQGMLMLGFKKNVSVSKATIQVNIQMPILRQVVLSGSGNISCVGHLIHRQDVDILLSGSGNIIMGSGECQQIHTNISGSGNIKASNISAVNGTATISGSGNIELKVLQSLDVGISGSGNVYYTGNPVISSYITGSGTVFKK